MFEDSLKTYYQSYNSPVRWEKGLVVSRPTEALTPSERTLARTASHRVLSLMVFSKNIKVILIET